MSRGDTMLFRHAIQTPDGTILESKSRHDFVSHNDTVSGENYFIDGGLDSPRGSLNKVEAKNLCVTSNSEHSEIRKYFKWGTYGKNGDQPLHHILLKDMTMEHLKAILKTQDLNSVVGRIIQNEHDFRNIEGMK